MESHIMRDDLESNISKVEALTTCDTIVVTNKGKKHLLRRNTELEEFFRVARYELGLQGELALSFRSNGEDIDISRTAYSRLRNGVTLDLREVTPQVAPLQRSKGWSKLPDKSIVPHSPPSTRASSPTPSERSNQSDHSAFTNVTTNSKRSAISQKNGGWTKANTDGFESDNASAISMSQAGTETDQEEGSSFGSKMSEHSTAASPPDTARPVELPVSPSDIQTPRHSATVRTATPTPTAGSDSPAFSNMGSHQSSDGLDSPAPSMSNHSQISSAHSQLSSAHSNLSSAHSNASTQRSRGSSHSKASSYSGITGSRHSSRAPSISSMASHHSAASKGSQGTHRSRAASIHSIASGSSRSNSVSSHHPTESDPGSPLPEVPRASSRSGSVSSSASLKPPSGRPLKELQLTPTSTIASMTPTSHAPSTPGSSVSHADSYKPGSVREAAQKARAAVSPNPSAGTHSRTSSRVSSIASTVSHPPSLNSLRSVGRNGTSIASRRRESRSSSASVSSKTSENTLESVDITRLVVGSKVAKSKDGTQLKLVVEPTNQQFVVASGERTIFVARFQDVKTVRLPDKGCESGFIIFVLQTRNGIENIFLGLPFEGVTHFQRFLMVHLSCEIDLITSESFKELQSQNAGWH